MDGPACIFAAVRYIGNKTKLLGFIGAVLRHRGIGPGTAVDPFGGTASVARALKRWGFRVVVADVMQYAYTFGRAYVELSAPPDLGGLAPALGGGPASPRAVARFLSELPPEPGFLHDHFTPAGRNGRHHERMYFTPENAARVDAIRARLHVWRHEERIDADAFHLLLASLLEAADRVANTAGVYAAWIKSWQPNALRPLALRVRRPLPGNGCRAFRSDALALVSMLEPFDLLYLDPPYNARQYPGYYHLPELIATGWFDGAPPLRGKTGLPPDEGKRSDWSRSGRCEHVFEELVARAPWRHLVMSYNAEGIIPEATIERVLKAHGRRGTYRRYDRRYRRYRSDADGANRRYRGDEVREYLYCVDR